MDPTRAGIVVVDDDPLMLAMLEPKLRALDVATGGVRTFGGPEAVLEWLAGASEAPRLVLSDYNLKASMTGLELLTRVSRSHPGTVRVLMSGYSRERIGFPADAPIHGFVEKGLRADDVVRRVAEIFAAAAQTAAVPAPGAPRDASRGAARAPEAAVALSRPAQDGLGPMEIFRRFISTTDDFAIFALDPQGLIMTWNPGAERIKGWTPKEVIGRHLSTFYPAADVAAHKPRYVLRRATEEGRFEDEGWRVRKDGSMFWANAVVTAVRDDAGNLMGFVKVTRDLTARRHSEDALRQSEERYRLFIESVKDYAMFVLDSTGHIMSWNQGAERLKGYRPEDIVGRHFSVFYTKADRDRHHPEEELAIALREGRYEEEGWRVKKDGTQFWANVTITALFDSDRRHIGFAKVTRDLTERKRAEEGLRHRAESYAELNRELDAFSHSVAHDLRAPLRAIQALTEHILEDARPRLAEDDVRSLEAILGSSRQMSLLVQDLLDLSLTARQAPRRVDVDLSALVQRAVEERKAYYPDRRVEVHVQPGLHAEADERLIHLALTNLVDNAIKFTRGPTALVEFGRDPDGAFFVRDQGVGFPPEMAPRLFQPFARLHSGLEFPGTGIGLTIVDRIVRRHGGRVWAESHEGKGTTFRFTLGSADAAPRS